MTANASTWAPPEWARDFCKDYTLFLFNAGKWTLMAGILLGILLAVATVYLLVRKSPAVEEIAEAVPATGVLDAARVFLQALSSAPTWLALVGVGVLLLWLSGYTKPEACNAPPQPCAQGCPPPQRSPAQPSRTPSPPPGNSR